MTRFGQRGVALVIALLVMGVIAGLATMLANEHLVALRRSENQLRSEQAWQYMLAVEELAALLLESDTDSERDHLGELWAMEMPPYPIEGGWLRGSLEDLQGRFNVNGLTRQHREQGLPEAVPATENERRFLRLVRWLGAGDIDDARARALCEAIIDWIDSDFEETGFGGAEDNYYGGLEPAQRPANQPVQGLSELRVLPEMDPELFALLRTEITAWPPDGSDINVNTARPAVLAALAPSELSPLDESAVRPLTEARGDDKLGLEPNPQAGFATLQDLVDNPVWTEPPASAGLTLRSDWFLLRTEVEYQGLYWQMESVLQRSEGVVQVRARALGGL